MARPRKASKTIITSAEQYLDICLSHEPFANPNPKGYHFFDEFMAADTDEVAGIGANRIGKTEVGSYRCATYLLGFDPTNPTRKITGPAKIWVISAKDTMPVIMDKLARWIPQDVVETWNTAPGQWYIRTKTGSELWGKTHDQERRQFQSQDIDVAWMDEEPPEFILMEIVMRLADRGGRIFWTATLREGEERIIRRLKNLDPKYRAAKTGPFSWTSAGFMQNPYIPEENKKKHYERSKELYKGYPDLFRICVLGEVVCFSGSPLFQVEDLDRVCKIEEPKIKGTLVECPTSVLEYDIHPDPVEGRLEIWNEPQPMQQYTIGADVSQNIKDGDFSVAVVFNRLTHTVDAMWHGRVDPYDFGWDVLYSLGMYYNTATLNPEANPPGNATINALRHRGYPRIAKREHARGKVNETDHMAFGALTGPHTKPMWVHTLVSAVADRKIRIHCKRLADEMQNFRRLPRSTKDLGPAHHKYAAITGHDDCVMALIHAYMCHLQSGMTVEQGGKKGMDPWQERIASVLKEQKTKDGRRIFSEEDVTAVVGAPHGGRGRIRRRRIG